MAGAADRQTDIPDPLRNLKVGDIIAITGHVSFEKPSGIEDDEVWTGAVEEVRAAVRAVRLDVPVDASAKNFLPGTCKKVDRRIKKYKGESDVDKKRLHDPVIDEVREQIGLFLSVRIRLGRNEKFKKLISVLRRLGGSASLSALERDHGLKAITFLMRNIANRGGQTVERREAIWKYIKEFLAEQAGLESVEFPGQTFTAKEGGKQEGGIRKKLAKLGITLTHGAAIERGTGRLERLRGEVLEAVKAHIAAVDEFLSNLQKVFVRGLAAEKLLSMRVCQAEEGPLADFHRRKKTLDEARTTLLNALNVHKLPPRQEKAYGAKLAQLEKEFAEPLMAYRELGSTLSQSTDRVGGMEALKKELEDKRRLLSQLEPIFRINSVAAVARGEAPAVAVREEAPGGVREEAPAPKRRATGDDSRLRLRHRARASAPTRTPDGRLGVDDVVSHTTFGRGVVLTVDKEVVTVQFQGDAGTVRIKDSGGKFLTKVQS